MNVGHSGREPHTLAAIRKLLLGSLVLGVVGTAGELILLRHIDMPAQWIPFAVLGVSVVVIGWHARRPNAASVRAMQALMCVFIGSGALGVVLHVNGNVEFERELHPEEHGFEFLRKVVAGATPVLAPGSLMLLGLIGLAHTHGHPSVTGAKGQEGQS